MTSRRAYRLPEMAEQLGVDEETLRRWAQDGTIPARKAGEWGEAVAAVAEVVG